MRGGRTFLILSGYLSIISLALGFVFMIFINSGAQSPSVEIRQTLGKSIFAVVAGMQLMAMCAIAPALTANAITSEREQLTLDLLRTTLLSPRAIITGKLLSALIFLLLLLFTAFPLQSLAFLFGGVAPAEMVIAALTLIITAFAFSALGIMISSLVKRTLIASVVSYTLTLLIVLGIPIILLLSFSILEANFSLSSSTISPLTQSLLVALAWFLISISPLATGIITEVILIEEQSAFFALLPMPRGGTFLFPSPWIGYCLLYLVFGTIFLLISVHRIKQLNE
jgi:ABC-type transport system involved in multi-copper enzyme maturation permease subunit